MKMGMMQLEKKLVEDWVIEKLMEKGWKYVEANELNRVGTDEPLLAEDLKKRILEINRDVELTEDDLESVVRELKLVHNDQNGHKKVLGYFKYGIPIKTERERIVKYIKLFDYKNPERNEFVLTNQIVFTGKDKVRLDILLFVNGIPLVNIECKNPYTDKVDYHSAYRQIKRYERSVPELYKYVQIGIGFAEIVKYFPIVPWLDDVRQEIWRWDGVSDDREAIFEMLKPDILLDIIKNFIFVREFMGEMSKVIARYMQYRAANKIYQRVMDNLAGKTDKNKGLIWHWQGSGKTLTMIFSAHKLFFELGKPTIFFIVDRKDLERQFKDELGSLELNFSFEVIESVENLREVLSYDGYRGKRGVFLTLIHKFKLEEDFILDEIQKFGEISKRKDVICFLDEVHRSQYGVLALKMRNILSNAFFFGFTGTPISYSDRNTYKEFGYISEGDPELYLDKYFIDSAERDGFVVPISYELRKEEVNLKDKDLEWYLKNVDIDDIADERELSYIEEVLRRKINEITVILENERNIETICEDISRHFKENFDGRFKGLIVTGSRRACVRFKRILDRYLEPKYSEVVMTFDLEDEEVEEYKRELIERFGVSDTNEIVKLIIDRFRREEYPKLLIVTDMLITGFDEPKLGVLYLYKILKDHRLLQTMARVNRPYKQKPAGLLVDYVGVLKYIREALRSYADEDVRMIEEKIVNVDKYWEEFERVLRVLEGYFGGLVGNFDNESFDKALEILKRNEDDIVPLYRDLRMRFEFLKSEQRLLGVLDKYKWFSCLYEYYRKLLKPDIDETKLEKYFKRTIELIHNFIEPTGLNKFEISVIDLDSIKGVKDLNLTDRQKYMSILSHLRYVSILKGKNPIYKAIADRVRELVRKWQEEGVDIKELYSDIDEILNYVNEKEREKERTGLDDLEFGIGLILERRLGIGWEGAINLAGEIYSRIKGDLYSGWSQNPAKVKDVKRSIREFLTDIKPMYKIKQEELDSIHKEICEFILGYD